MPQNVFNLIFLNHLCVMKKLYNQVNLPFQQEENEAENDLQGYPLYPDNEDIYRKLKKVRTENPDDVSDLIVLEKSGKRHKRDFSDDMPGAELDIPGADLDDEDEIIGNEDEENNYYSLGGDDHIDLEENLG